MKFLLSLLVVLAIIAFLLYILTVPTIKSLADCIAKFDTTLKTNMTLSQAEVWDKETICRNGKPEILELQTCYEEAGKKSILPVDIYFRVLKIFRPGSMGADIKEIIRLSNLSCSDYPQHQVPQP